MKTKRNNRSFAHLQGLPYQLSGRCSCSFGVKRLYICYPVLFFGGLGASVCPLCPLRPFHGRNLVIKTPFSDVGMMKFQWVFVSDDIFIYVHIRFWEEKGTFTLHWCHKKQAFRRRNRWGEKCQSTNPYMFPNSFWVGTSWQGIWRILEDYWDVHGT